MVVWNLLRALILIEAVMIIATCAQIWRLYFERFRIAHAIGASDRRRLRRGKRSGPERSPWMGLLPAHVWKVAIGVPGMSVSLALLAIARVDTPPVFSGVALVLAFACQAIVLLGLREIIGYEDRLIARRSDRTGN